jgi:hypothetical protein
MAGAQSYMPNRQVHVPDRPPMNMDLYSASQHYRNDSPERGLDERTSPYGPHSASQREPQDDDDDMARESDSYDGRDDAIFFPPNSVSAQEIQQRRQMINGARGAVDR